MSKTAKKSIGMDFFAVRLISDLESLSYLNLLYQEDTPFLKVQFIPGTARAHQVGVISKCGKADFGARPGKRG